MTDVEVDMGKALYVDPDAEPLDLGDDFQGDDGLDDLGDGHPAEKRPTASLGKREPLTDLVTFVWGGIGMALVQSHADPPVGRVMQFQAPLAGRKFDQLIAGTWLDALLQPLAKQADKIEGLGALVMFPLLVGAYERNPALEPIVAPILRQVVRSTLVDMAPVLRKQSAEAKKAAETVGNLNDLFDLPPDADPIDAVLMSIFAPPQQTVESETPTE